MLYILDGSGFLFRAYYSLPPIKDKEWNNAWAIFGFFRMILKLLQQKPDHFIIVFDPGTKTKRQEEFKEYKANRPEIDDNFKKQIPQIINILKESWFDVEIIPEYEADDVIASIVKSYPKEKVIVSSDKDLKQLIDDKTNFLEPKKMELIDKENFKKEYWFEPKWMILYLALLGDSSDNIPWIKWIWKKTASEIVKQYSTYEELEKNLSNLPESIQKKLKNNLEQLKENIKLIQLRYPGNFSEKEIEKKSNVKNINFDKLKNILIEKYWFKSFDSLIDKAKKDLKQPENLSLF
jgi:DNA polymerase-1